METGISNVTLDEKGRFIFPIKMRKILEEGEFIMTYSFDKCLQILSLAEFSEINRKITSRLEHQPLDRHTRNLQRRLIAPATEVTLDKASRLSLPRALRDSVGLFNNTEAIVLFFGSYFEIWSSVEYYNEMNNTDYQESSDIIFGGNQ